MLINQLQAAIDSFDQYSDLNTQISHKKHLIHNLEALNKCMVDINQVLVQVKTFQSSSSGYDPVFEGETLKRLKAAIKNCKIGISRHHIRPEDLTVFSQVSTTLLSELKTGWLNFVKVSSQELIQSLRVIHPLLADPERGKVLTLRLTALLSIWPPSKTDLNDFVNSLQEGRNLIAGLNVEGAIREFLELVVLGNATIADLNDEILQWIRDHHLEKRISVAFKLS